MKPFNLELAKQGKPVQTRDGRDARIICFDAKDGNGSHYIVALVYSRGTESVYSYNSTNGRHDFITECGCDLFMAPVKKSGWINIYGNVCGDVRYVGVGNTPIYRTKEDAKHHSKTDRMDTIYIEWEE